MKGAMYFTSYLMMMLVQSKMIHVDARFTRVRTALQSKDTSSSHLMTNPDMIRNLQGDIINNNNNISQVCLDDTLELNNDPNVRLGFNMMFTGVPEECLNVSTFVNTTTTMISCSINMSDTDVLAFGTVCRNGGGQPIVAPVISTVCNLTSTDDDEMVVVETTAYNYAECVATTCNHTNVEFLASFASAYFGYRLEESSPDLECPNPLFPTTDPPSATPSDEPSSFPSVEPSVEPSFVPSVAPSDEPSSFPSIEPSAMPSVAPSDEPSMVPSVSSAPTSSSAPSVESSEAPSSLPSNAPSSPPSGSPTTASPTQMPTVSPTAFPSPVPTAFPTAFPSPVPTASPSISPTSVPSDTPTVVAAASSDAPTAAAPSPATAAINQTSGAIKLTTFNLVVALVVGSVMYNVVGV
eukprot:CAMPEP_0118693598 /NCGR_PEP_ID=MMETSP0800-20121206/12003_1 /TAXON_ID=210618 ORGANISM="Striatella unipunctata, Strain CCMP2910" /NCGR_SAMPLE_ID=MMETSP0800 /ASSEMBLY_ACC=CAM_ASM_000638 /LENGTH=408 /DNA_ID=CAMNT_0006591863 /DNA_START=51 /DNA_END=1277 /DNA_ORIENTATION=-